MYGANCSSLFDIKVCVSKESSNTSMFLVDLKIGFNHGRKREFVM
jgi:hypothetical protein